MELLHLPTSMGVSASIMGLRIFKPLGLRTSTSTVSQVLWLARLRHPGATGVEISGSMSAETINDLARMEPLHLPTSMGVSAGILGLRIFKPLGLRISTPIVSQVLWLAPC